MVESSIFKSYDIRGIYPTQLNEHTAYQVGIGFVKHTGCKKVVVGHDARLSSLELFRALAEGLASQGIEVCSIGQVPTEAVYFALGNYDFDGGIMVTASHNPKEYNGFKMLTKKGGNLTMVRGKDLLSAIESFGDTLDQLNKYLEKDVGKIYEMDIWQDYTNFMVRFLQETIKPFKIVVDASNGVMGRGIVNMKDRLPVDIIELNFDPDGNFPNHSPNPLEKGSADQISKLIKEEGANFGIMFDGDADRIFLVDEKGMLVPADIVLLMLAKHFLTKNPGTAIAYNAVCSKAVPELVAKWGGTPLRTPVGFVNVRDALIKNGGVVGGEISGHYCFKDYWYMDSGMITFLTMLQIISQENKAVSELVKELSIYFKSEEMNFEVDNKEMILEKVKEKYQDGKQDFLDGITVEYKDWWFNVRPSNTEPLLRISLLEAKTQKLLDQKKRELRDLIAESKGRS